jgi:hypothetical protein
MESWKIVLIALAGAAVVGSSVWAGVYYTRNTQASYSPEVIKAYQNW